MKLNLRATGCHLPYGITQCYLSQVNTARLNPSQTGRYSIYPPRRDGRLSWLTGVVVYLISAGCGWVNASCRCLLSWLVSTTVWQRHTAWLFAQTSSPSCRPNRHVPWPMHRSPDKPSCELSAWLTYVYYVCMAGINFQRSIAPVMLLTESGSVEPTVVCFCHTSCHVTRHVSCEFIFQLDVLQGTLVVSR